MYKLICFLLLLFFNNGYAGFSTPPLTKPLKKIYAPKEISEDDLVNADNNLMLLNYSSAVVWYDNERLVFDNNGKIELINVVDGKKVLLSEGSHPKISPNREWIVFIGKDGNENQFWLVKIDGSEKRQLSHFKGVLAGEYGYNYNMVWSPDSTQLAFYSNPVNPLDLSDIPEPPLPSVVQILDVKTGSVKQVYTDTGLIGDLSWYPDGKKLLMTILRIGLFLKTDKNISTIQSVNLIDGVVSVLKEFKGLQQGLQPKLSPDGHEVSFLYNAESDIFNWMLSLGLIRSEKTDSELTIKQLTFDLKLTSSMWSKDAQVIYFLRNCGAYDQIYALNVNSGEVKQITNESLNIYDFDVSPDETKLAWRGMDAHGALVIGTASIHGKKILDFDITPPKEKVFLSEVREVEWDTIDYPSKMRGLLFLPNNYKEGTRYPLIVDIHGGGSGAHIYLGGGILTDSPLEWQWWTKKGYAVFVPEFRSSAAFGALAILRDELQEHDIIHRDTLDIIAGVDELVRQGIADNDRLAAIGHSAGGRRANWLTVSSNRFKAIVSKEGWADEWKLAMRLPVLWEQFGGSPLQVPENYLRNSAIHHSKKGTTPTLFLMGNPKLGGVDADYTVRELYEALKENGVETDYIEYSDEGHNLELPKNRKDALERITKWIDSHFAN